LVRVPNTALGSNPMRKTMPLRWIEEAEARQVLAIARSQSPAPPFTPVATKAPWSARVRRRFAAEPAGPSLAETTVPDGAVEPRRG
jgi:hypothetical protein